MPRKCPVKKPITKTVSVFQMRLMPSIRAIFQLIRGFRQRLIVLEVAQDLRLRI